MSTPTSTRSAYPVPVEELLPRARQLAVELGAVPSRNRLMGELKIGAGKASTIRQTLVSAEAATGEHEQQSQARLRLVSAEPASASPERTETEPDVGPGRAGDEPDADHDQGEANQARATTEDPTETARPRQVSDHADSEPPPAGGTSVGTGKPVRSWPVLLLALPAFVAIWSGWVGLGGLTGFGIVHPLPGIADEFALNTAITLPIGVETYAAYALRVWLSGRVPARARTFAKHSALGSLALGALGQVAYHLMSAAGMTAAPWWITTAVACLPVAVLGMGAALTHLLHDTNTDQRREVA